MNCEEKKTIKMVGSLTFWKRLRSYTSRKHEYLIYLSTKAAFLFTKVTFSHLYFSYIIYSSDNNYIITSKYIFAIKREQIFHIILKCDGFSFLPVSFKSMILK